MDPTRLAKEAPGVARRVDPRAAARLAEQEQTAKQRRQLALTRTRDGEVSLSGLLDAEGAATLSAALDPLAAPAPSTAAGRDPRRPGQRMADALVELARRALTGPGAAGRLPDTGGDRPQLIITMTLDQLRAGHDALARLDGGLLSEPLSGAAARRLACDAQIIPAVLGADSELLDLGRARRTASPAQRRALRLRDRGCVGPGCDRPPPGASPTTSCTGPTAAPPTSPTSPCSAPPTTTSSTTAAGPCGSPAAGPACTHPTATAAATHPTTRDDP